MTTTISFSENNTVSGHFVQITSNEYESLREEVEKLKLENELLKNQIHGKVYDV